MLKVDVQDRKHNRKVNIDYTYGADVLLSRWKYTNRWVWIYVLLPIWHRYNLYIYARFFNKS